MSFDYQTNDPRGWGGNPRRGAALGRPTIIDIPDRTTPVLLRLSQVRLNAGGYDCNGTYFGVGSPLFWCRDNNGDVDFVVRGHSRDHAKADVRSHLPEARFYR